MKTATAANKVKQRKNLPIILCRYDTEAGALDRLFMGLPLLLDIKFYKFDRSAAGGAKPLSLHDSARIRWNFRAFVKQ